jgi:ferric-dicitrate binding protein FerR (iron transport regulator)
MKDFRLFDISDFVMDEDFIRWVNEKKKVDNDFWENWLGQYPGKHMVVAEARRILESIGTEQKIISETEKEQEIERLMRTILGDFQQTEEKPQVVPIYRKWWKAAAVLLIGIAGATVYFTLQHNNNKTEEKSVYAEVISSKHLIESINTSEKAITLRLPDQSTVELAANSRIAYANNFDSTSTRDVYLLGEGFFKVTKNPSRPFRVFANEIVTKVLGTSFIVRSFDKDSIVQVTVKTGKVSVYSSANEKESSLSNELGGIILTPNQKLVYQKSKQKFQKALLDNPTTILPDEANPANILYEDVSLEKVFSQLSKTYGINVVYDNELLKKCTVTADLRGESFYRKIDLICKAIGARYEIIDGQVVVQSNGCE